MFFVHYRVHNSLPRVPILREIKPVCAFPNPIYWISILILSSHLHVGLPSRLVVQTNQSRYIPFRKMWGFLCLRVVSRWPHLLNGRTTPSGLFAPVCSVCSYIPYLESIRSTLDLRTRRPVVSEDPLIVERSHIFMLMNVQSNPVITTSVYTTPRL
jgi:hypothetical protein